jgi:hypothetical protein
MTDLNSEHKSCPYCNKEIKIAAIKCRYCKKYLENKSKNLLLILIIGVVFFLIYAVFGDFNFTQHADKNLPYSVLLNRFRNFEEAKDFVSKVKKHGDVDPYIVPRRLGSNGIWNEVHSGALKNKEQAKQLQESLYQKGILTSGVRNYNDYKNSLVDRKKLKAEESKENYNPPSQSRPQLGKETDDLIRMFPVNTDYEVEEVYLVSIPEDASKESQNQCLKSIDLELLDSHLPLGMRKQAITKEARPFGFALYRDPVDGSRAWVVSGILKNPSIPSEFLSNFENELESHAKNPGNKFDILIGGVSYSGKYFIRRDSENQEILAYMKENSGIGHFYLFSQTERDWSKVRSFIQTANSSDGLLTYKQVREHIYTLPKLELPGERFFFYALNRLTENYANIKGNADWAERMVGHWQATGLYLGPHDITSYEYFDLAYYSQAHHIYEDLYLKPGSLYSKYLGNDIEINGHKGRWVQTGLLGGVSEVNYRIGKDIVAADSFFTYMDKNELIERAKKLQL